jgi:NTP pyrophosphatase (non-canonical NTP hydrolase)
MTLDDFQACALRTWNTIEPESRLNAALGLAGEVGETCELVKKARFHGKRLDTDALLAELGDVLYYVAVLAYECGHTLDGVAAHNVAKLRARYPDGFVPGGGKRGREGI